MSSVGEAPMASPLLNRSKPPRKDLERICSMTPLKILSALLICVPLILAGCGGGGGSDPSPQAGGTGGDIGATGGTSAGTGGTSTSGTGGGVVNTGTGDSGAIAGGTSGTGGGTTGGSGGTGTGGSTGGTPAAGVIALAWDAAPSPAVGYKIYYGTRSGVYGSPVDVRNVTAYTLGGLAKGQTYYITASAYDAGGSESGYTDEVNGTAK